MIRLSLFISLLPTSAAVLAGVQINIRGNIYIPPCTINNGQNIIVDFGDINPEHVDNSRGEVTKTMSTSCLYKSGSFWIGATEDTTGEGQNNIPATNITHFGIALYQRKGISAPLTLGNGPGNGHRATASLNTARSMSTSASVPFYNGSGILSGGSFRTTVSMSMTYN